LSLKDVRAVAQSRFYRMSPWKWDDWVANTWLVLVLIVLAVFLIVVCANATPATPYVKYIIPQSFIEQGKDIEIVSHSWGKDTVNGYVLDAITPAETSNGWKIVCIWAMLVLIILFTIAWVSYAIIRDYKRNKFVNEFTQKWIDNKDIPDM
jgi:heme/copper-type cytochrome/quinol oxidase subunit 2